MAVNNVFLDFSIDPSHIKNENQTALILTNIENILRDYLTNLKLLSTFKLEDCHLKIYASDKCGTVNLKAYLSGLITLNIEYLICDKQEVALNYETSKALEKDILQHIVQIGKSFTFVPIKRGTFVKYYPTSDDRLLEYDIDELVFEERTPFQKIQIVHSKSLGNMLVLDDVQNIAEADLIYTETLMARGKENYKGKEIIILGGGDGALLYELLKEDPKEVIMLEIDEIVMKACAKYMRSICGNVLDSRSGPNYKIIVGDCMKTLDQYINEGRKFDYIFGDLTDVPISEIQSKEMWNFVNLILQKSFKALKPDGKYMTHLIGSASTDALKLYESHLKKIKPPVKFSKSNAFIPSFLEDWVFGQISFLQNE